MCQNTLPYLSFFIPGINMIMNKKCRKCSIHFASLNCLVLPALHFQKVWIHEWSTERDRFYRRLKTYIWSDVHSDNQILVKVSYMFDSDCLFLVYFSGCFSEMPWRGNWEMQIEVTQGHCTWESVT